MPSKYVYFRDATGKAAADGQCVPTQLLAELGQSSFIQNNGGVAWKTSLHNRDVLLTAFTVRDPEGKELNAHDTRMIIENALDDAAKKAPGQSLGAKEVLQFANRRSAAFFQKDATPYVLVASMSVASFPARKIRIRGCGISPMSQREPKYPLPLVLKSRQHSSYFAEHLQSTTYRWVKVATKGRSIFEGVENALNALNLLRSLWSFAVTFGRHTIRLGSGLSKPIGVIHLGPVYTLHNPDGSVATEDYYWFDPNYRADQRLFRDNGKWQQIEVDRRWAVRRLKVLPYGRELEKILMRYIAALDQADPNVAFLQLWGILEKVTDTVGGGYNDTIKRACRPFRKLDRSRMKETLDILRLHRNRYVHGGDAGDDNEQITNWIKWFVDPHIYSLLRNDLRLKSITEYGTFLGYPTEIDALARTRKWASYALRAAQKYDKEVT